MAALLMVGFLMPHLYMNHLLSVRDGYLSSTQKDFVQGLNRHSTWHYAYLAMGFVHNTYIPDTQDDVAYARARAIKPDVVPEGAEYEGIMRTEVFRFIRDHPDIAFLNVAGKSGIALAVFLLSANLGIWAACYRPKPRTLEWSWRTGLLVSAAPGILALPHPQYLLGLAVLSQLYALISLDFAVSRSATPNG